MLTMDEQKLLMRYLIQLLQLQARDASLEEFRLWRHRVNISFPRRIRKKTPKSAGNISSRYYVGKFHDYEQFFDSDE
jgi:hypothetical protein